MAVIDAAAWQPGPRPRIMIASHSHPALSNGGSEIAAFHLFRTLQARDDVETWFLGCDRLAVAEKPGAVLSQPYSDREYIYAVNEFEWFKFANRDTRFPAEIAQLLTELRPDVIHFHHFINFGVEVFEHVKRALPACRIVLTLHEYLAICHHYGQMITKGHRNLCYEATPSRCQGCFPDIAKSDFFLRKLYIERFFGLVDQFVAPSAFLAERFLAWGIPADKMTVLENLLPADDKPATMPAGETLRLGFFGQISALKGIDVLFDAAASLAKDAEDLVSFEIFGDYSGQPPEFQAAFLARLETAGANVHFHGPYDRQRVDRLMQSVHAVLVPSIWWENSPVVIQEALRNRRPVICSDIGGMAEKVRDGVDGFHFAAGSAMALAGLVRGLVKDRARLAALTEAMTGKPAVVADVDAYMALYGAGLAAPNKAEALAAPA